jgi:transcriptional regulator with XRE-family HTH domain
MARTLEDQLRERPIDPEELASMVADLRRQVRGARLREVRQAQGMTQVQVAAELHVAQNRVSQIERGDLDRSRIETVRRYVEALGGELTVEASFGDARYVIA